MFLDLLEFQPEPVRFELKERLGLAALKLLPFKLPTRTAATSSRPKGFLGEAAFGLVMGGGVSVASLACNPGIFIVLGVAVLQGYTLWTIAITAAYAVGFSLPLALIMLGTSFGKSAIRYESAWCVLNPIISLCR